MKNNALMLSLLCLGAAPTALAQSAVNYDGSIESGYYHDSGLVVTAVDQSEQDSDTGFKNRVQGQVDWAASPKWQLSVGGQWQEHNYQRRNEYDQQLYLAHAGASYNAGKNRIGLSQHFAHSRLQGEALLDFSLTSIDWGRRLGDKHYLRLAAMNRTKNFSEQNQS